MQEVPSLVLPRATHTKRKDSAFLHPNLHKALEGCCGLNVCVSLPNSYVEILTLKMMVFEGGALGGV